MSDAPEAGPQIKARRERLGMSGMSLAAEARVDRGRLRALEAGDPTVRQSTIASVLAALDRVERRFQMPNESTDDERTVKITIRGNFGVETTLEGPAREVEEMAGRLIDRMSAPGDARSPMPELTKSTREAIRKSRARNGKDEAVTDEQSPS